ncbi:MAG TPA: NAD(P)/FAD-dependent oxidoreductase [Opitutaceae bacterium]|nr:NAD(P)/FAD-dependent oxidoreductase [Opitutaceae bacterium]
MDADVIVVGAGFAGLAAARTLAAAGKSVLVLEARRRAGGRAHSVPARGLDRPVELGAEFIHGGDPTLRAALRRAGLRAVPVPRDMWLRDERGLHRERSYWAGLARSAERIPPHSALPLADALRPRRVDRRQRRQLRAFVEGFYAAPAGAVSARSIREDEAGASAPQCRPDRGYAPLVRQLLREATAAGGRVRLGEEVREIRWRRGAVELRTRRRAYQAAAAVVTVPLGVLRTGRPRFRPRLREKQGVLARIGWGEVARITVRLRSDWWRRGPLPDGLAARGRPRFGFLSRPGEEFPTWWAPDPRAPVLVGWSGGPKARRLARLPAAGWRRRAIASLARIMGVPAARLRPWIRQTWRHDWSADPFSRGAYSFPLAGRESAPRRLARPVARTLYFAGEATAVEAGTVQGALGSGERAARELLEAG